MGIFFSTALTVTNFNAVYWLSQIFTLQRKDINVLQNVPSNTVLIFFTFTCGSYRYLLLSD